MPKRSAGLLIYRWQPNLEVLLVHPGGPFFKRKDNGYWSIPKGEIEDNEEPMEVARREFQEETGNTLPDNVKYTRISDIKNKSGKIVSVWMAECNFQQPYINSNLFPLEWPPRSGKIQQFPEADTAQWFDLSTAKEKIYPFQRPLLADLERLLVPD